MSSTFPFTSGPLKAEVYTDRPFGASARWNEAVTVEAGLHEGGLDDIRAWYQRTKATGKPIMVIIDVLAKVRRPTGNRPAYEADYEALTGLAQLANELSIAIVVIHHTRKMAAEADK